MYSLLIDIFLKKNYFSTEAEIILLNKNKV